MREMKDSGIEWIGEIPKEWKIIKCKYTANLYTGNSIKDEEKANYEDSTNAIPYIATKDIDVTFSTVDYENGLYINNDDLSFSRANTGDTLMCIEGGSAGRKKALLDRKVCFVNKLCCFHPVSIVPTFLYYLLNSPHYEEEFKFNISGLIGGVSKNKLLNFSFPFPSIEEQRAISAYLYTKCTKIDSIIEKQEKVIEKLKAYKLSVITEAVTKGLNPDVKMKDSGIEWIGEIPEQWEQTALKIGLADIQTGPFGSQLHAEDYIENGIYVINPANIINGKIVIDSKCSISSKKANELVQHLLSVGDIVFARRGEMGRCACAFDDNIQKLCGTGCIKLKCNDRLIPKYIIMYLQTQYIKQYLELNSVGITMLNLNSTIISNIPILIPPISEQQQIADYLDKKCSAIDKSIEQKQAIIEKLKEYKKSLIYEVVTGKKEVLLCEKKNYSKNGINIIN